MSHIPWLEDRQFHFPDTSEALREPDGLLAVSQQLTPELVIDAYLQGIFPWYTEGQPVLWWSPNPRCVFYPEKFHVSRSFRRTLNQQPFTIKVDTAFREVMLACAEPRPGVDENGNIDRSEPGTWITDRMLAVYCRLHDAGVAHSIECWQHDELVGGMYGLVLGDVFFGESMFSRKKDASKVALHYVCTEIKPSLLDAQVSSPHLHTMGAELIEREDFIRHIQEHRRNNLNLESNI